MTPQVFLSDAWDVMEKYGAYPMLTGEGSHYRPYNYKGYTSLRRLPSGSEPGSPNLDAKRSQHLFSCIFWEGQDIHDHVFDLAENWDKDKGWVKWWTDNGPLLKTMGKIDFGTFKIGVLRDIRQNQRYKSWDIFKWDISRGALPSLGLTPVLVDGTEFMNGKADRIPVLFDCATTTMEPEMVDAVLDYVEQGGIFVAQHHTGQHLVDELNAYPLATALGLTVIPKYIDREGSINKQPLGSITFTNDQDLIPSLQGRKIEGSGASINHLGVEDTGAIGLSRFKTSTVKPIAFWDDGSMAIAEVQRGKGRFIYLASPFYLKMRDTNGKFFNLDDRQALLEEMLNSLGVYRETASQQQ